MALRVRLPQRAKPGSAVPYAVALEVRRLRCSWLSAAEAKRTYALTDKDIKLLHRTEVRPWHSRTPFQVACGVGQRATVIDALT